MKGSFTEDIAPLALHLVKRSARRRHRPAVRVTQATLRPLAANEGLGNIREFQNAVERAVMLSQGGPLRFELPDARDGGSLGRLEGRRALCPADA